MQKAADTAIAGDTVYFLAGTYAGALFNTNSGTASQPITYKALDGAEVIVHREPSTGTDSYTISAGTTWTAVAGATHQWKSPTTLTTPKALLRNNLDWFMKTNYSNNVDGHIAEVNPNWFYAGSNYVEVYSVTDPTLDAWTVIPSTSNIGMRIYNGVQYLIFDGFTVEYNYHGIVTGNGNTAGQQADHLQFKNIKDRYNASRGIAIGGEPNAPTTDHLVENSEIYRHQEVRNRQASRRD